MKGLITAAILFCVAGVSAQVFDVTSFGAVGNGTTLNTSAFQAAIDSCHHSGGGIVRVAGGNFVTATVYLKSNVTIQIDSGATITGAPNTTDYPDITPLVRNYTDNYTQRSVFYAEGQHNIGITGKGTFNGNGISVPFLLDSDNKPYGFRFISCTNVRYEGITMRNSGFWMMHNHNIDTLAIKNLTIINQNLGNGDGINIDDCRNVLVDSCTADCNDDPLVIKTTSLAASENIAISHCVLMSYSRAIKIGTEIHGAVRNVHIHDIEVKQSNTAAIDAKCGINLSVVDGGSMENVLIENVTMSGIRVPLLIRLGNRARKYTDTAAAPGVGFLRNIELRDITAVASTNVTSSVTGIPGYAAQNIRLKNIDITFPGGQPATNSNFVVPENVASGPEATIFGDTLPAAGLYMRHLDSILLQNVCFHSTQYDQRPTLVLDDVAHFDSSGVCIISSAATIESSFSIRMYPNPVNSELYLETAAGKELGEVVVYDIAGQIVQRLRCTGSRCAVPVYGLATGVYVLTGLA
ncbi:MAG TPA: glycosyl hydrolase family 28 protein, partial [Chitinophagales bacterium]|nr:glycosyl hydrolase family 28 protein [Chitinophagales bacterium]